ncbi:hypothetical protein KC19_2G139200 [Ceratodon purpureus]|uniref:Uncharacterized protein n=1 Tax=Ceratodon purpureus TaxID=3225 RepID=A0A8T0ITM2_CERPU|nr:hypothetical protein KC19_2G139200 [Ceratodon purpureus]
MTFLSTMLLFVLFSCSSETRTCSPWMLLSRSTTSDQGGSPIALRTAYTLVSKFEDAGASFV